MNEEPDWDGLSTRVYQLLDLHFPNGSFLPNLQRLTCFIDWEHFTWIKLFLPPSLLYIDLNTFETKTDPIAGPVLELLPMESLQALHLEDFPLDAASVRTLSSCLLKLSGPLQDLIVYHKISSDAAVHISQLSNLRVLGISFRESNFTLPRATDRFPALKSLYAQVDDNLDWLGLLKDMRAGLMYLSISWVEGLVPPPTFTHQLVSALRTSGAQDTLRTLRINASKPWDISGTEMTPLLSLHNLTNLEIQTPCHEDACAFDLADADVAQLASSLRKLKTLILGGPRCVHPSSRFTMDGLFFLSKYCTSLNDLEVHFNAPQSRIFDHSAFTVDEGRVPIQNLLNRASNCSLRWLYVHELPFPTAPNSVGVMTYFLIHLFPHLDTIAQTGSLSESWAETQRGIQAWQAFRRITVPGGTCACDHLWQPV